MERAQNLSRKKQENVVKLMDLTKFILDAHDTKSCGNVLDLQRLRQDAPQWIECIKQHIPPCCVIYILSNSVLSDDVNALYITRRDHYANMKNKKPTGALDKSHQGPQVILYDMWRGQGWDIITHGGFLTYFHHDVLGVVTFVTPRLGEKMWGIIKVKEEYSSDNRVDLFKEFNAILDENSTPFEDRFVMGTILLEEGDMLYIKCLIMFIVQLCQASQDPATGRVAHSVHPYKRDDHGWTSVDL
jgi:hypothetical protein